MLSLGEVSVEISWCRPRLYLDMCWSKQSVSICQRVVDNLLSVVRNKSTTYFDRCLTIQGVGCVHVPARCVDAHYFIDVHQHPDEFTYGDVCPLLFLQLVVRVLIFAFEEPVRC